MKLNSESICDDNGIELLVSYKYDKSDSFNAEPENGNTEVQELVYTELKFVELVIAGRGINILPLLHENEKEFIISKLQYK